MRTGHIAISLGLGDELLEGVQSGTLRADATALRQWHFRIARRNGDTNPYLYLLPEGMFEHTLSAIVHSKTTGVPLAVDLNGGIGDHLEALCLLLPWATSQHCCLDLVMSAERRQLIEPLLPTVEGIKCKKKPEQGETLIPAMALRAGVIGSDESAHYRPWILQEQKEQPRKRQWLCCWRAEGVGDKLSAHSRSVPLILVHEFYQHLKRLQPHSRILDITNWSDLEASQLQGMDVDILDPRKGTLLELAQKCQFSHVITIDTALVHLCAACGLQADHFSVLIPMNAGKNYTNPNTTKPPDKHLALLQFGSWSATVASLIDSLSAEDCSFSSDTLSPKRQ